MAFSWKIGEDKKFQSTKNDKEVDAVVSPPAGSTVVHQIPTNPSVLPTNKIIDIDGNKINTSNKTGQKKLNILMAQKTLSNRGARTAPNTTNLSTLSLDFLSSIGVTVDDRTRNYSLLSLATNVPNLGNTELKIPKNYKKSKTRTKPIDDKFKDPNDPFYNVGVTRNINERRGELNNLRKKRGTKAVEIANYLAEYNMSSSPGKRLKQFVEPAKTNYKAPKRKDDSKIEDILGLLK